MEKITCCHHLHTKFLLSNLIFTSLIINSNSLTPRLHLFILLPCICAHIYIVIHHARSLIAHCVVCAARGRSEDDQLVGEEGHGQPHRLHDLHRRHQRRHRPRARQRHLRRRRLDGAISTPVHYLQARSTGSTEATSRWISWRNTRGWTLPAWTGSRS